MAIHVDSTRRVAGIGQIKSGVYRSPPIGIPAVHATLPTQFRTLVFDIPKNTENRTYHSWKAPSSSRIASPWAIWAAERTHPAGCPWRWTERLPWLILRIGDKTACILKKPKISRLGRKQGVADLAVNEERFDFSWRGQARRWRRWSHDDDVMTEEA